MNKSSGLPVTFEPSEPYLATICIIGEDVRRHVADISAGVVPTAQLRRRYRWRGHGMNTHLVEHVKAEFCGKCGQTVGACTCGESMNRRVISKEVMERYGATFPLAESSLIQSMRNNRLPERLEHLRHLEGRVI